MLNADFLSLPDRAAKPRSIGITAIIDPGLGAHALIDLVESAGDYIDFVKFGWGTGLLVGNINAKIDILKNAGIDYWFGGTLFEIAHKQNRLDDLCRWIEERGAKHLEISDGALELAHEEKLNLIRQLKDRFILLSEVGSKDAENVMPASQWISSIRSELEAGAWKVIAEGRESGTAGIFRANGEIREELLGEIISADLDMNSIIFEAPQKAQQVWLLRRLGHQVNFGNIEVGDAIGLETLRLGLRSDTMPCIDTEIA